MHEPNEIWGVQVVQGAVVAVRLRRGDHATFEIESAYVEPNDGTTVPVHVAALLLARTGLRGHPAVVALPDASECLVTVTIPAGVTEPHELERELYKHLPFEPGHAEIRHVRVARDGGSESWLVAALAKSAVSAAVHAFERKRPLPALAFGGAATVSGARALGLCPDPCVLVEVEPHTTVAYVVEGARVRRRAIPVGDRDVARDPALTEKLAQALLQIADGTSVASGETHPAPRALPFVLVGPGATAPRIQQGLGAKLGKRLAGGTLIDARVRSGPGARLHHPSVASLTGAVGAALEAFAPLDEQLLLRPLPADLRPPHSPGLPRRGVAAVILVCLAVLGAQVWWRFGAPAPTGEDSRRVASPAAAEDATRTAGAEVDATLPTPEAARKRALPSPAGAAARPTLMSLAAGRVRVAWPVGGASRVLRRSGAADATWTDVATLGKEAGSLDDEVPGPTQIYRWRIDDGDASSARVEVPVAVEFLGPGPRGGARFLLRRTWRGAERTQVVEALTGEAIRGSVLVGEPSADVALDPGMRLDAMRARVQDVPVAARVPRFLSDGRVERSADGGALLYDKVVPRQRRVIEAESVGGDGTRRTWTLTVEDG